MNAEMTFQLVDLQAQANRRGWTVRSVEVPADDAEALFPGARPDTDGSVGTIDRMRIVVGEAWEAKAC